ARGGLAALGLPDPRDRLLFPAVAARPRSKGGGSSPPAPLDFRRPASLWTDPARAALRSAHEQRLPHRHVLPRIVQRARLHADEIGARAQGSPCGVQALPHLLIPAGFPLPARQLHHLPTLKVVDLDPHPALDREAEDDLLP